MHTLQGRDYDQSVVVQDAKKKQKSMLYLFLFKRTAKIEVKKFNSRRAVPVVVLNKQSLRGDNDGCCNTMRTSSLKNKRTPKKMLYKNSCQIASELKTNKSHKHLFTSSHNCQKTRAIQHFNNTESSHSYQNNKTKNLSFICVT